MKIIKAYSCCCCQQNQSICINNTNSWATVARTSGCRGRHGHTNNSKPFTCRCMYACAYVYTLHPTICTVWVAFKPRPSRTSTSANALQGLLLGCETELLFLWLKRKQLPEGAAGIGLN